MSRNPSQPTWSEERVEKLRELWFSGWSASECGAQFGVSRNSIIGVVHRRGWQRMLRRQRPPASKAVRLAGPTLAPEDPLPEPAPKRVRKPAAQLLPKKRRLPGPRLPKVVMQKPDPPIGSFTLMDLHYGVCKWPENDGAPWLYCGAPALENESYCADHHRRAHQGPQHRALRPIESYAIRRSRQAA